MPIPRDEFGLPPRLLSTKETADMLGVRPSVVRQWTARGHIRSAGSYAGRTYYLEADLWDVERALRRNPDTRIGVLVDNATSPLSHSSH